ncbi:hypothetical protein, partial [Hymenobacter sp. UV11]|uniref:hypothetical protein n=1 Tax=Hymenobacter sp. UV11 TaxID=1849735 RepID=UPI00141521C0
MGLADCQSNTTTSAETKAAEKPAAAVPAPSAATEGVGPPFTGYHRYRGTVGGQPVTVELTVSQPPLTRDQAAHALDFIMCEGSYHYDRHSAGGLLLSGPEPFRPSQPLLLAETDPTHRHRPTGHWQASQPLGPVLTGTWRSPAGQALPFNLHEDYTDGQGHVVAVKYEILQESEEEPTPAERQPGESKAAYRARTENLTNSSSQDYLHLLGPDTLRPELRPLQCPGPAERRRLLREDLGYPGGSEVRNELTIVYNDYGLLSLTTFYEGDYKDAPHPEHGAGATTYDLRTGRALTIAELIRPGTDTILSRLIIQHLASDEQITADDLMSIVATDTMPVPLPQQGLGVVAEGLSFTYTGSEIRAKAPKGKLATFGDGRRSSGFLLAGNGLSGGG